MVKLETDKYIITETPTNRPEVTDMTRILQLDDDTIKGAFGVVCVWFHKDSDSPNYAHSHDFDEVIAFIGTDSKHPGDLGGEVELWLGGEKHIITKSFLAFIPKGLVHCPLIVRKVDRPIFHFATVPVGKYQKKEEQVIPSIGV